MAAGELIYALMLVALVLWLLPAAVPLAPSTRGWLVRAAVGVLALAFLAAFVQIGVWLVGR